MNPSYAPERPWNRVLVKFSGEAFAGGDALGIDPLTVRQTAGRIAELVDSGIEVSVVVGGGNMFRGPAMSQGGMDRARADYMGMLGTVINCLALQDFCEKAGVETRVQTAIDMRQVAEPYVPRRAIRHLEKGRVVIFGAGLGQPYFSTDTTAAQRALEIGAQAVILAKNGVDGVYDADPRQVPDAKKYDFVDYQTVLEKGLKVADATAISLCMENGLPLVVYDFADPDGLRLAAEGKTTGTMIGS